MDLSLASFCLGVASALVGGVFLAFSDFIMRGLAGAPASAGIYAMQGINRSVLRSLFLTLLLGLVPASIVIALLAAPGPARLLLASAAVVYFIGVFGVTVAGNVPMNKALDSLAADTREAGEYWLIYLRRWTRLNHVRTLGSFGAAVGQLLAAGIQAG